MYVSEIPTNRLRANNVALASFMHWVHNLAVSKATPVMLLSDPYRAYFIFGAFNFAGAVAAFWLPETKGVSIPLSSSLSVYLKLTPMRPQISLERMDEVFGVADFSNVEDVGVAAKQARKLDDGPDQVEDVNVSKV